MGEIANKEDQGALGERMLAMIRQRYPQYHPLLAIADLAHATKTKEDPRLELECHKTLVKYVTPELKSVEVKADIRSTRRVVVSMFDGSAVFEMDKASAQPVTYDAPVLLAEAPDPLWGSLVELEDVREELAA